LALPQASSPAPPQSTALAPAGRPQAGILLLVASIGLITVVDATAKYLSPTFPAMQLTWGYFLGIVLHVGGWVALRGGRAAVATTRLPLQLLRSALLVGSITCLFVGFRYLPLAETIAIAFMGPLFLVAASGPILGERVGARRWAAVLAGFAGVLVIVRPGSGLGHWAAFMPLLSAACFAGYQLTTRQLALSERVSATMFWTAAGGFAWSSLSLPFAWVAPEPVHWLVFVLLGSFGAAAHLLMIRAFQEAPASLLAPFNYSKLIWAALYGWIAFGDLPTANTLAGSVLIVGAGVWAALAERHAARRG